MHECQMNFWNSATLIQSQYHLAPSISGVRVCQRYQTSENKGENIRTVYDFVYDSPNPTQQKTLQRIGMQGFKMLADREGFEPSDTLLHHTLSKRAHSTTLPSVRLENA